MTSKPINYLTIDVEDYFQVAAFEKVIHPSAWENYPPRVEQNTIKILDLFDLHGVKGTFFIVGWTAERFPGLVKDIAERGHEIGCHSYWHKKIYNLTPEEFRQDTKKSKAILEEITGQPVLGYRAPTYSITKKSLWALDILEELGFKWDSSIFPTVHDNYGIPVRLVLSTSFPAMNSRSILFPQPYFWAAGSPSLAEVISAYSHTGFPDTHCEESMSRRASLLFFISIPGK